MPRIPSMPTATATGAAHTVAPRHTGARGGVVDRLRKQGRVNRGRRSRKSRGQRSQVSREWRS